METNIRIESDAITVCLTGRLNFETTNKFRESLEKIKAPSSGQKIIFDLEKLEFVGSSGISTFIQMLREFNSRSQTKPIYSNVKNEFKKVIAAFDNNSSFEFIEN